MKSSKTASAKGANMCITLIENAPLKVLSMATIEDCERIAKIDADAVSSHCKSYVTKNFLSYYFVINTWVLQVREGGERGCLELLEAINTNGLLSVIADCATLADELISSEFRQEDVNIPDYLVGVLGQARNDREVLQWLRYPKRFSPDGADLLQSSSIAAFLAVNKRCRRYTRVGYPQYWIERIRERVHDMLRGYLVDWNDGFFSAGVAADSSRPLMDKLFAYSEWDPKLFHDTRYPIGHAPTSLQSGPRYIQRKGIPTLNWWAAPDVDGILPFTAMVRAVPKSYKSARIIAMEHAYRQFHMQAIRIAFERCLKANGYEDCLNLHDQSPNQELAFVGAIDGRFATIDLSSASDSLSRDLAYSVLPNSVVRDLDQYLPKYFIIPGDNNPRLMHMFCTSGSAVTFPIESIVFLAILLEVRETVTRLTHEVYEMPQVFGDDLVVDVRLYDTTVDVLTRLGFVVNTSKSFGGDSSYRESCGVEFFHGYDTSSRYWPRTTLRWSNREVARSIESLCALQHRLYGSYGCQKFLALAVRHLEPRMTSHIPGTDCSDLWEPIPRFLTGTAPVVEGTITGEAAMRELHLTLKTRRSKRHHLIAATGFSGLQVVEMWRYTHFLRYGRMFESELDRLLGVSSKPQTIASDCDVGEVYWAYVKE